MNKCSYLTNELEYGHDAKYIWTLHVRTRWYTVFIDRSYHSPVIASTKALQRVFMPSFVMLYTENISLQDFANQVTCLEVIDTTNFFCVKSLAMLLTKVPVVLTNTDIPITQSQVWHCQTIVVRNLLLTIIIPCWPNKAMINGHFLCSLGHEESSMLIYRGCHDDGYPDFYLHRVISNCMENLLLLLETILYIRKAVNKFFWIVNIITLCVNPLWCIKWWV